VIAKGRREPEWLGKLTVTVAGKDAIMPLECRAVGFGGRGRKDNWAIMRFAVVDVSDPTKPKLLSHDNVLGGPDLPASSAFDRHLTGFGLPKRRLLGGYKTILAHFGAVNCGAVPHGDALFIQSATHLCCIAETDG
jgi:hypothetical protein